jgi:ribosome maturation factor RimP
VGRKETSTTFFLPKNLSKKELIGEAVSHWDKELAGIYRIAEPLARTMGFEILLIEQSAEPGRKILRIILDKPESEGITVDDCADFSRALEPILDVETDLEGRYHLEVSSPGLNRPLVVLRHFRDHLGETIQLVTDPAVEGRRNFKGRLEGIEGEGDGALIKIKVDQAEFTIPWQNIKRAHLDYFATEEIRKKEKRK